MFTAVFDLVVNDDDNDTNLNNEVLQLMNKSIYCCCCTVVNYKDAGKIVQYFLKYMFVQNHVDVDIGLFAFSLLFLNRS